MDKVPSGVGVIDLGLVASRSKCLSARSACASFFRRGHGERNRFRVEVCLEKYRARLIERVRCDAGSTVKESEMLLVLGVLVVVCVI